VKRKMPPALLRTEVTRSMCATEPRTSAPAKAATATEAEERRRVAPMMARISTRVAAVIN